MSKYAMDGRSRRSGPRCGLTSAYTDARSNRFPVVLMTFTLPLPTADQTLSARRRMVITSARNVEETSFISMRSVAYATSSGTIQKMGGPSGSAWTAEAISRQISEDLPVPARPTRMYNSPKVLAFFHRWFSLDSLIQNNNLNTFVLARQVNHVLMTGQIDVLMTFCLRCENSKILLRPGLVKIHP